MGGAPIHRLSCLPFYCFGEDHFFLLLSSFLPSLSSLIQPLPLLFLSPGCAYSEPSATQQGEREGEIERRAQPQFEVSSLSPQSPVLLFTLLLGIFLSAHLLCRCLIFDSPEGASVSVWLSLSFLFSFSLPIWLCGEEHLCMCVTVDQRGCGYQRLPAAATIPWAVPVKRRW